MFSQSCKLHQKAVVRRLGGECEWRFSRLFGSLCLGICQHVECMDAARRGFVRNCRLACRTGGYLKGTSINPFCGRIAVSRTRSPLAYLSEYRYLQSQEQVCQFCGGDNFNILGKRVATFYRCDNVGAVKFQVGNRCPASFG